MNESYNDKLMPRFGKNLKNHWLLVFLSALIGLTIVVASVLVAVKPQYDSTAQLVVQANAAAAQNQDQNQKNNPSKTVADTLVTPTILQPAIDALGLKMSPDELAQKITVQAKGQSQVLNVTVRDESPYQGTKIVNAVSDSFTERAPEILGVTRVTILTPAEVDTHKDFPSPIWSGLIGAAIGLVIAGVYVLVMTMRDDTVYSEDIVHEVGWSLIGVVPEVSHEEITLTRFKSRRRLADEENTTTKRRL
ncbi:MAG: hypothetical protein Q4A67_05415 [Aerococcus sp.]|nr:hypothetical protein [Aerococcus sp.]